MTTTLTDRYVHAATRWLPKKTRTEVAAELRERISDTVAANGNTAEAERNALEELGDPLKVAVSYTGHEPALIGARFFFTWLRLTVLLVVIVPTVLAALAIVGSTIEGDSIIEILGSGISTFFTMSIQVAFWTTVVFAVLDWSNTPEETDAWSVEQLPEPDPGNALGDLIAGLVFLPLLAGLLLWQQFGSPIKVDGEELAFFDPALWSWYLPLLLVLLALDLCHLFWIYKTGPSWSTAIANAALAVAFAVPTIYLLAEDKLLNPVLVAHFDWDAKIVEMASNWTIAAIALISAWEIFDGFRKALLHRRDQ